MVGIITVTITLTRHVDNNFSRETLTTIVREDVGRQLEGLRQMNYRDEEIRVKIDDSS